jgi:hypothetical protein
VKGKTNKDYPDKRNAYNKKQKGKISKIPGKNARPTTLPGKVPRGSHRMPDGTIMKNKDMKKYSKKNNNLKFVFIKIVLKKRY